MHVCIHSWSQGRPTGQLAHWQTDYSANTDCSLRASVSHRHVLFSSQVLCVWFISGEHIAFCRSRNILQCTSRTTYRSVQVGEDIACTDGRNDDCVQMGEKMTVYRWEKRWLCTGGRKVDCIQVNLKQQPQILNWLIFRQGRLRACLWSHHVHSL